MYNAEENQPIDVTIIIPCRNEEGLIPRCLNSLINNDYPKDKIEVLVIDGISEDKTREIIREYSRKCSFIKLLENPKKFTNFAFNIGIRESMGEIIMIMGAHASYEKNYISECVKCLKEYNADNVGGVIKTLPREKTLIAKAIAICLSHSFGVGDSYFRKGSDKPKWVDTVFGGCYKKEVFKKIGFFNENLIRNQDMEFNLRLKKNGGKILLVPNIIAYYYPDSNFRDFFKHNFKDGLWVTYPLKYGIKAFSWRHLIALVFVSSLMGSIIFAFFCRLFLWLFLVIIGTYLVVNFFFSVQVAKKEKSLEYLLTMPMAFGIRHISYGLGSIWGLIKKIKHENSFHPT